MDPSTSTRHTTPARMRNAPAHACHPQAYLPTEYTDTKNVTTNAPDILSKPGTSPMSAMSAHHSVTNDAIGDRRR